MGKRNQQYSLFFCPFSICRYIIFYVEALLFDRLQFNSTVVIVFTNFHAIIYYNKYKRKHILWRNCLYTKFCILLPIFTFH